jgi:hypothetical protein
MDTATLLVVCASTLILLVGAFFFIRARIRTAGELSYSLGLGLLKVQLPPERKKEDEKGDTGELRQKIAVMEQVYNQLATIKTSGLSSFLYGQPFFSIELAVPHVGAQVVYYVAVPRRYLSSAEKLIQGVYPEAYIERVSEYTIFHPGGAVAAAQIKPRHKFLPIRTYQVTDGDPLASTLNAFSKIAHEGEGMALQIVARKAGHEWTTKLIHLTRALRQGKSLASALAEANRSELSKTVSQTLQAADAKKKQEEQNNRGPANEQLVKIVENKAGKILFETNVRIVTAAKDSDKAEQLLRELITPFAQFTNEETNTLTATPESGRGLQKVVYQYSFRVPDRSNRIILSAEELTSIVHLPNTIIGASNVSAVKAKSAPAPVNVPKTGILLGVNVFRGTETEIRMMPEDRLRHFYIIGQTGTGKTYGMRNMIIQDIEAGNGVCFIDPHGDMVEEILGCVPPERIKDVVYFNPGDVARPMGLNMLEYDPRYPEQKTFVINELLEIFNKLYDMKTAGGPMFEQYFRNATGLVMEDPASGNTLLEINRVFVDKKFRDYKLSRCANPLVKTFWRDVAEKAGGDASLQNIVPYISSKFDSFLSNDIMRPIVSQEHSAFKLRDIMDSRKILLINLSKGRLGELNSSLIGLIMVGKILLAAFSRADQPVAERKDFFLYADEFQNVATSTIETILSEARKYRLGLVIAHQFIGQLEDEIKDAVFGNVGSIASFRIGAEDAEFLEKQFAPTFAAPDLINIDNRNCYVRMLINGQTAPAFSMKTLAGKKSDPNIAAKAKEFSRLTYGRDKSVVDEEMREKFAAVEAAKAAPKPAAPF